MPGSQESNDEILRRLRYYREYHHRRCREYFFVQKPLILPSTFPSTTPSLPITLEQVQDSCNKYTAIYYRVPESKTLSSDLDFGIRSRTIINSIYQQWFRGHHVDIEFGNFVAKLIAISTPLGEQERTVQDISKIHKAWYDYVIDTLPLCSDTVKAELGYRDFEKEGVLGINRAQHMHYELQPLFRALIIVIDKCVDTETELVVHLVSTGFTSGLSAPITFESIEPKLLQTPDSDCDKERIVATTLSAAIDFVMALELREQLAFPDQQRDLSVLDRKMGSTRSPTESARSRGYTGPKIRGPSTCWIKLKEGEVTYPPVTSTLQNARVHGGLPPLPNPLSTLSANRPMSRNRGK